MVIIAMRFKLFCVIAFISYNVFGQSYNADKISFTNFIIRMYENAPFEGVRIVEDNDRTFLVSILSLEQSKYKDASVMNRVASVKSQSQASKFFNGSNVSSDMVIKISTTEQGDVSSTEIVETIKENSAGYVKSMELLSTHALDDNRTLFIFCTKIN